MGNRVKSAQPCRITTIIFINIQSTNYPLKPQPGDLPIFKYMTMLSNMFPAQEHFQGCAGYVASQNQQLNVLPCTGQGLGLPFEGDVYLQDRMPALQIQFPKELGGDLFFLMFPYS